MSYYPVKRIRALKVLENEPNISNKVLAERFFVAESTIVNWKKWGKEEKEKTKANQA